MAKPIYILHSNYTQKLNKEEHLLADSFHLGEPQMKLVHITHQRFMHTAQHGGESQVGCKHAAEHTAQFRTKSTSSCNPKI